MIDSRKSGLEIEDDEKGRYRGATGLYRTERRQPAAQIGAERIEGAKGNDSHKTCSFPTQLGLCSHSSLQEALDHKLVVSIDKL
jgi:hypothetical protein